MTTEQYFSIQTDQLPIGGVANHPLLDQTGNILLEGNAVVTQDFLYSLKKNQVKSVFIHKEDRKSWGLAATAGRPLGLGQGGAAAAVHDSANRVWFDPKKIIKAPQPIIDAVEQQIRRLRASAGGAHLQPPSAMVVPVMPVNERYSPIDDPFEGVLRELSSHGAVLFHSRAVSAKFLIMELTWPNGKSTQFVIEIQDKQLVGRFYEIRGRLVAKIE